MTIVELLVIEFNLLVPPPPPSTHMVVDDIFFGLEAFFSSDISGLE